MLLDLIKEIHACREVAGKCNTALMQQRISALETKNNGLRIQVQILGGNLTVAEARINRYLQEITSLHTNCDNEKKRKS